jgi:hypothetical protein
MNLLANFPRSLRLIDNIIDALELNLSGLTVLTEAASGPFVCTALIAARAGAKVYAVTKSSSYGSSDKVIAYTTELAKQWNLTDRVILSTEPASVFAADSDIVTNLGFVRPINKDLIASLPNHAAISLMWEGWEYRPEDLDLRACREHDIAILGTNETHPSLKIFEYIGIVAVKLLLESGIEIFRSRIAVVSSDPFGKSIVDRLTQLGAEVFKISYPCNSNAIEAVDIQLLDALVIAEHRDNREIIGFKGGLSPALLSAGAVQVVHIAGNVDDGALMQFGINKLPAKIVKSGYMTVTTDYCGPRPVIDLHAGGLKVGEMLTRARLRGLSIKSAEDYVMTSGLGSCLPECDE